MPAAPAAYQGRPGTRLRLRLVNAGGDTAFRMALGGHRMTVTHTDGFPVQPVDTDALLLGMGERYDVLVTLADGVFPLVALAEGKGAVALGLVRTGAGTAPTPATRPPELDRRIIGYRHLQPTDAARLPAGERVRIDFANTTTMWHPVHLHGHTFAAGDTGVRCGWSTATTSTTPRPA